MPGTPCSAGVAPVNAVSHAVAEVLGTVVVRRVISAARQASTAGE